MRRLLLRVAFLVFVLWANPGLASDALKVNTSIKPPFSTQEETGFFDLLLKELGSRISMDVQLVRQPPARALVSANEGLSHAELPRIAGLQKTYPNLIQIEEKVIDYEFVAFTRGENTIKSWDDLAGKKVGYLIGWKIFENNVPAGARVYKLKKPEHLFRMLEQGRIDVALYECHAGWGLVRDLDLKNIKECGEPLAVKPMFMYLHKDFSWEVPAITGSLRDMKVDGTYQRIKNETLGH